MGGFIGPLLFPRNVRCRECGATFNKTTGKRNRVNTIAAVAWFGLVGVGVVVLMFMG